MKNLTTFINKFARMVRSTLSSGSSDSNRGSISSETPKNLRRSTTLRRLRNLNVRKSSQLQQSKRSTSTTKQHNDYTHLNGTSVNHNHISSTINNHKRKHKEPLTSGCNNKTRTRKRRPSSSEDDSVTTTTPPKRQRTSAIAAKLKITQSPTAHKQNNLSPHLKQYGTTTTISIENAETQTNRSHNQLSSSHNHQQNNNQSCPSNTSSRFKRARSISSSCSRKSPLFNGSDCNENNSECDEHSVRYRCPVEGCNSEGHLSGKFESHFTQTTCPIFHNLTSRECEERYLNRRRGRRLDVEYVKHADNSRPNTPSSVSFSIEITPTKKSNRKSSSQSPKSTNKIPTTLTNKSPNNKTTIKSEKLDSDKSLLNRLVEHRKREINHIILQNSTPQKKPDIIRNPSREPNLRNLTPIFDYEMFKEAQAKAAEQLQEKAKDVKMRYGIKCIDLGRYEIDVWYGSPYPEEYRYLPKLFICEFCLKYMTSAAVSSRHVQKCSLRHPPGNEIYRKGNISFFEVDGQQNEIYCQNLCLLAKLFLDHKTLYFDVAPFLFYVMTEYDEDGFHILGYFSKEKNSILNYNVSCILTLPPYQKQGYGKLLIDLSYLMTRLEGKVGSPEKPLSDMGLISYRSYWKLIILEYLCNYHAKEISIKDISQETGVNAYDIISTLQAMGMLKYWKGKHLILTRQDILDDYRVNRRKKDSFKRIDPSCLKWSPTR